VKTVGYYSPTILCILVAFTAKELTSSLVTGADLPDSMSFKQSDQ
jgi:hypothetical protein